MSGTITKDLKKGKKNLKQVVKDLVVAVKEPEKAAERIELVYVNDTVPGFSRKKFGKNFRYLNQFGETIRDGLVLRRIKSLGIPPAYRDVWICLLENGHLQATGIDSRGRKQYRYHPKWRQFRSEINHLKMLEFGAALPAIRKQVEFDINQKSQTKNKVLATIVKLMDLTTIRVGNQLYAEENSSYGLTTMRDKHVKIQRSKIKFEFRGKSNKKHIVELENKKLAKIIQRCMDIPGYELFQYLDKGEKHVVSSSDVNEYLKLISGENFTAKDFRTWWGTVLAMSTLCSMQKLSSQKERKHAIVSTVKKVSQKLGNTPAVCKKYYIYPALLDKYLTGNLSAMRQEIISNESISGLSPEEILTLDFLRKEVECGVEEMGILKNRSD